MDCGYCLLPKLKSILAKRVCFSDITTLFYCHCPVCFEFSSQRTDRRPNSVYTLYALHITFMFSSLNLLTVAAYLICWKTNCLSFSWVVYWRLQTNGDYDALSPPAGQQRNMFILIKYVRVWYFLTQLIDIKMVCYMFNSIFINWLLHFE